MMTLRTRLAEYVRQLEGDAQLMGECLPEGEVLAAVAEQLRKILSSEDEPTPGTA